MSLVGRNHDLIDGRGPRLAGPEHRGRFRRVSAWSHLDGDYTGAHEGGRFSSGLVKASPLSSDEAIPRHSELLTPLDASRCIYYSRQIPGRFALWGRDAVRKGRVQAGSPPTPRLIDPCTFVSFPNSPQENKKDKTG